VGLRRAVGTSCKTNGPAPTPNPSRKQEGDYRRQAIGTGSLWKPFPPTSGIASL